ncbi:MAG: 7-cyano-7-deazaguanine synthase QueC [Proteobacteria bacterium]|nr:7-cyano-7-deazaguanine synthase QueC [Desulfobulbaceae bacterium]MBU4153671.1 7-cyano-7-deazaguanine synthase QueC [Pseudomonadota bacterium]
MSDNQPKAVILLSGGLDSTTVLAMAKQQGYRCYCLSFAYGQRQSIELERARENAARYQAEQHLVLEIGLGAIGGSALTADIPVPKNVRAGHDRPLRSEAIPVTYVPGRNTIFLAYAMAWAEVLGAWDIFIGVNAMDYSGYPDCRPEYLDAFARLADLGTKAGVLGRGKFVIHAPLLRMSKREIVQTGMALGVDYQRTHSCYDPSPEGLACGVCDSCQLRRKGFVEAGLEDPAPYQKNQGGVCG